MSHDFNTIYRCAFLSHHVYYKHVFESIQPFEPIALVGGKCLLCLDEQKSTLYIVFSGSNSVENFLANLKIAPIPFEEFGNVHTGYYDMYSLLRKQIINFILAKQKSINKIIVTGHSAGGSAAVLAGLDAALYVEDVLCVTFGSPVMADEAFIESYNKIVPNTIRVYNSEDIVPKIILPKIQHVGKPLLIPNEARNRTIVRSHSMLTYLTCLKRSREGSAPHDGFRVRL
jgi:hypothetical protein